MRDTSAAGGNGSGVRLQSQELHVDESAVRPSARTHTHEALFLELLTVVVRVHGTCHASFTYTNIVQLSSRHVRTDQGRTIRPEISTVRAAALHTRTKACSQHTTFQTAFLCIE